MSYAIVRNEKLTRVQAQGICVHNDRKTKNHSNKEIDVERTHLNYYLKKNKLSYIKEFDRIKKENNLQGQIRSNSIIMCEMIFTSDKEFFDKIWSRRNKNILLKQYKLKNKCAEMEEEFEKKSKKLEKEYNAEFQKMHDKFSNKEYELKREFNRKYDNLLDENNYLRKIINTFEKTVKKFIKWIVRKK